MMSASGKEATMRVHERESEDIHRLETLIAVA